MRTGDARGGSERERKRESGGVGRSPGRTSGYTSRRRFLQGVAASGVVAGIAGCTGEASSGAPFAENPVAEDIASRPTLGQGHEQTPITLVFFDDPSCPYCAQLHEGAFRKIESEWVDEGRATVYSRFYPFVEDWARPAVNGLLETHARDPATYWKLTSAYFRNQDELYESNVADKTAAFLDDIGADVDTGAVKTAVRERSHRSVIDEDESIAREIGVRGVPTVYLFHEGEFVTTLGDDGFDAYRSAIESRA